MASLKSITDPKIKTLFVINSKENKDKLLSVAFSWRATPEGNSFWSEVESNPNISFEELKCFLPKNYKYKNGFIKVDSLYRIAVPGMKFKAVTKYGVEFQGVIAIKGGMVYLCNNKFIGFKYSYAPGYKYYLYLDKGGKRALLYNNIKSVSILYDPELKTKSTPSTEYKPVKTLEGVKSGTKFTALIRGTKVKGKIQKEGFRYFLCQDSISGMSCIEKLGYKFSYSVREGSESSIRTNSVSCLQIEITKPVTECPKSKPTTEYKPVKTLEGVKSGTKFTAEIEQTWVEGKIQREDGRVFLCQDKKNGTDCRNKLGYKYSWVVGDGSGKELKDHDVTNVEIEPTVESKPTPDTSTVYKDLQVTFCKDHVVINGVKITDEQLEGIAIAQGLFEIVDVD